jgi:hypothetical protein
MYVSIIMFDFFGFFSGSSAFVFFATAKQVLPPSYKPLALIAPPSHKQERHTKNSPA